MPVLCLVRIAMVGDVVVPVGHLVRVTVDAPSLDIRHVMLPGNEDGIIVVVALSTLSHLAADFVDHGGCVILTIDAGIIGIAISRIDLGPV